MQPTTTAEAIRKALTRNLGTVFVHEARPKTLFQVELPAYAPDGDAFQIYIEPTRGGFRVTDKGATLMRASYGSELDEAQYHDLTQLAFDGGLGVNEGAFEVEVDSTSLLAAVVGLLQTQVRTESVASRMRAPKRARRETDFQARVEEIITSTFGANAKLHYRDSSDRGGDYELDAFVTGVARPLAIAIVPSDLAAERAIASKLTLVKSDVNYGKVRWLHVPLDAGSLARKTVRRLDREYDPVVTAFDDAMADIVKERLEKAAA